LYEVPDELARPPRDQAAVAAAEREFIKRKQTQTLGKRAQIKSPDQKRKEKEFKILLERKKTSVSNAHPVMNKLYDWMKNLVESKSSTHVGFNVAEAKKAANKGQLFSWVYQKRSVGAGNLQNRNLDIGPRSCDNQ
jgi:hypothetical protein